MSVQWGSDMLLSSLLRRLLASLAAIILVQSMTMAAGPGHVIGWIEIVQVPGKTDHLTISGHALALAETAGTFKLAIERIGKGGKTATVQSGKFGLGQGEDRTLSTTAINVSAGEQIEISLVLSVDGREVTSVTVRSGTYDSGKAI